MADEQNKWLDRETAELLLRGEPLEAAHPAARDRAERLVVALGALSAAPAPTGGELPGEAAALAAYRKVREERADASAGASAALRKGAANRPADAGLVRIGRRADSAGRPRWSRPLRLGLAAALTVGMVGSVAVAAGTGVLPTPFDRTEPEPAATVSAAASPDRPLVSPSPLDGTQGGTAPGGTAPGAPEDGTTRDGGKAGDDRDTGDRDTGGSDARRSGLAASCRKVRSGRELDGAHNRALKEAAGGPSRVGKYCGDLLAGNDTAARKDTGGRDSREHGDLGETVREGQLRNDTGDSGGKGDEDGKGNENGKGEGNGGKKGDDGDGKGGEGGKGGKGDKDDDDDSHIAPPDRNPHGPHGPHGLHAHHGSHGLHAHHGPRTPSAYAPHPSSSASAGTV
ncbi:hypothetical protein ACGH7X_24255 [Streptomyces sp. BBFR51]|uniref:hypothetical protein n=1 Tax=Streptomyces sp. BBFR51 TaxID=3372856 RepID=UPI0037DCB529